MFYEPSNMIKTQKKYIVINKEDPLYPAKFRQSNSDSLREKDSTDIFCAIKGHFWCLVDGVASCLFCNVYLSNVKQKQEQNKSVMPEF